MIAKNLLFLLKVVQTITLKILKQCLKKKLTN